MYNLERTKDIYNIAIVLTNFYKFKNKIVRFAKTSKHHYEIIFNSNKISRVLDAKVTPLISSISDLVTG